MGITLLLDAPLFEGGSSTSTLVPAVFPVALAGHAYLVDLDPYERQTVELLRQQADDSPEPSERSYNPVALWGRSVESWHHGAGQTNLDLPDSDRQRFRSSKGIDPWTPGQIGLLPDTDAKRASANTNVRAIVAGTRLYVIDGQTLLFTTDVSADSPSFTTVTGTPASTPTGLATDGFHVWAAYPTAPYVTDTGISTAATFGTQDIELICYALGRIVVAHNDVLYELDNAGAVVGTSIFDHPNSSFRWDVIAAGTNVIYAAGHAGTKGELYRIEIDDTTTALAAPSPATFLPDGEYVTALLSYVGLVVLGTNKGVRIASPDASGNLTYGPLVVETGDAVYCLEGEDRFVWFGWSDYDSTSTGLGRLDLSVFTETLRPAYASDLMVTDQGDVLSVVTFGGLRVLTVATGGVFAEHTTKVASGSLDSGLVRWGTTERKVVVNADVRTKPLPAGGTVVLSLAYDDETFESVATLATANSTGPSDSISTREEATEQAETRLTLSRATVTTTGPTVLRSTVKALPIPGRTERILVPLIFAEGTTAGGGDGQHQVFDTADEFRFLKGLEAAGVPVVYQEGEETWTVTVQRVGFKPSSWSAGNRWLNGTCFVTLETI